MIADTDVMYTGLNYYLWTITKNQIDLWSRSFGDSSRFINHLVKLIHSSSRGPVYDYAFHLGQIISTVLG